MEKQSIVSVWIGKGPNQEAFNRLLEYTITDGEFKACIFCQFVGVESYDPDYFGGKHFPKEFTRPKLLFHGTELASTIETNWPELPPTNCYVLLYNFEFDGEEQFELEGFSFRFLGCFASE